MRRARESREQRIEPGAAFTLGGTPKPADPSKLAAIEVGAMREKLAVAESIKGWRGSRVVFALGIGVASVTALAVAGIFIYREMVKPDRGIDWTSSQRAVAGIDSPQGEGSAFLVEAKNDLWLVTAFEVVGFSAEVNATFRDPATGAELLRLAGIRSKDIWVDKRFLEPVNEDVVLDEADPAFQIAAANVEMYRPQIESLGIKPLEIAENSDVRMGARIVALGQAVPSAAVGTTSDSARHALFDGTVSSLKNPEGGPAHLQASANYEQGCAGGPILLEPTREVAGVQVDPLLTSGRRVAILGEHISPVLRDGVQLGSLRRELEKAALIRTGSSQGVQEALDWPIFSEFDQELVALQAQGWEIRSQNIVTTDGKGIADLSHVVSSRVGAQIALAVLSRESMVPVEIGNFDASGNSIQSVVIGGDEWVASVVMGMDASATTPIVVPPATRLSVLARTTFLGQPIRGRIAFVFLERDPSATVNPPPVVSPPAPPPPPSPAPVPSPAAVPGVEPASVPQPSAGGLASIVEFDPDYCNETVFASSILGLTAFDEQWLSFDPVTGRKDIQPLVEALEAESDPNDNEDDQTKLMKEVRMASLQYSATRFLRSRPVFDVLFRGMPADRKVAIYAEVRPHGQLELLPVGKPFLASFSSEVKPSDLSGNVPLSLPWNNDRLHQMQAPVDISVEFTARYEDGTEDRGVEQFRVLPPSDIEQGYPCGLSWATLVDETHPYVRAIINSVNQDPELVRASVSLTGSGGDPRDQLLSAFLIWKELVRRGLRYQNLTGSSVVSAQRVRAVHESLCDRNANCVDGAVLFASFLKAIGLRSYLVLVPGHALVAVQITGGPDLFIETTVLGTPCNQNPSTPYDSEFAAVTDAFSFVRNDSVLYQFESACDIGNSAIVEGLERAEAALGEWKAVIAQGDPVRPDGSWRPEVAKALQELADQLLFVDVEEARFLGVRPIGVPPDLEQRYPLPK